MDSLNIIQSLRQATASAHEALHIHPLLNVFHSDMITMDDYLWCLQSMRLIHTLLDEHIFYEGKAIYPALEWLENDFKYYGLIPIHLDVMPNIPQIHTESEYMGYLYVVLGSTLGGQVISKHLKKHLGLIENETNHFFAGFGKRTGEEWKSFLAQLEYANIDKQSCVKQALETFEFFKTCCDNIYQLKERTVIYSVVSSSIKSPNGL